MDTPTSSKPNGRLTTTDGALTAAALIFDMDGTIVDNMPFHNRVWIQYLTELGASPDPTTFHERSAGKTNPEILRMFVSEGLLDSEVEAYSTEKERRYRAVYEREMQPIPGVLSFITRMRAAGMPLALATSAGRENIDFVLRRIGLEEAFSAIVSAEDVTQGKPNPQAFLLAAQRLGIDPAACLAFEDSTKGIEAANRAGMRVVAVLTALSRAEALALPGVAAAVADYTALEGELTNPHAEEE